MISHANSYIPFSHGTMCMGRIASSAELGCNQGGDVSAKIIRKLKEYILAVAKFSDSS